MPTPIRKSKKHDRLRLIFAQVDRKIRRRIEEAAESEGISLSDVVRRAVMRDLARLERKSA